MKLTATFAPKPGQKTPPPPSPRTGGPARSLALAYKLQDLIERGLLADYTAAAKLLGVSQPRLTHLMSLTMLAPTVQEALLLGTLRLGDKQLRRLARIASWREQLAALPSLGTPKSEAIAPDVPVAGLPRSVPSTDNGDPQ